MTRNIWIVIPTYNERGNVASIVPRLFSLLPDARVLVVDDNSPDGTAEVVRSMQHEFPRLELLLRTTDKGFGRAYLAGLRRIREQSGAGAILMMDADLSHDPEHIPAMLKKLETCDAVIGSRYVPDGAVEAWELHRRILSKAGNRYVRAVTGMPFRDCSSGFLLIRAGIFNRVDLDRIDSIGYAFQMELKYAIWRSGAKVEEAPITFRTRAEGESKLSRRIVWEGLRAPWKVRAKGSSAKQPRPS